MAIFLADVGGGAAPSIATSSAIAQATATSVLVAVAIQNERLSPACSRARPTIARRRTRGVLGFDQRVVRELSGQMPADRRRSPR